LFCAFLFCILFCFLALRKLLVRAGGQGHGDPRSPSLAPQLLSVCFQSSHTYAFSILYYGSLKSHLYHPIPSPTFLNHSIGYYV
jgi:hypothetical protein